MTGDQLLQYDEVLELQRTWIAQGLSVIWTIYEKPADYPVHFVARPTLVGKAGGQMLGIFKSDTLEGVQGPFLHMALFPQPRDVSDDAVIVETWF